MEIKVGGIYKHYKNKFYKVHHVVTCAETLEVLVIYECLYENPMGQMWSRPAKMFTENIEQGGKLVPRFALEPA